MLCGKLESKSCRGPDGARSLAWETLLRTAATMGRNASSLPWCVASPRSCSAGQLCTSCASASTSSSRLTPSRTCVPPLCHHRRILQQVFSLDVRPYSIPSTPDPNLPSTTP